jgi:1-deoxy-D-xylulose-5-phosphate reductoisomerase
MKAISLLGSTGSIGMNTLRVTASFSSAFRVMGLSGGRNVSVLADQVEAVRPEIVSTRDQHTNAELQNILGQRGYQMSRTRFVHGVEGNIEVSCHPEVELVLSAIAGAAGLLPTYRALESGDGWTADDGEGPRKRGGDNSRRQRA